MKKEVVSLIIVLSFLISMNFVLADLCTLKGYTLDDSGDGIGNATVKINVDDPSGSYKTKSDGETYIGFYQKPFSCSQGSSKFDVMAYNSTHYGEASIIAENQEITYLDVVINKTIPEDGNPPKYYNDNDDARLVEGVKKVAEGEEVTTSVLWEDGNYLERASLYSNITGDSDYLYSTCDIGSKNVSWCNRTIDTSGHLGETICWKQYAEDMEGNSNDSMTNKEHCFYVDYSFNKDSIKLVSPEDGKTGVGANVNLEVEVTNPSGDNMDVGFYDASHDSLIGTKEDISNGSSISMSWSGLRSEARHDWYVLVSDGFKEKYSNLWSFTTGEIEEDEDRGGRQYTTYRPKDEDLEKGYKKKFFKNWDMDFNVGDNSYNAKVRDITDEGVDFTFNNQVLSIGDDETKKFDLNEDGYYDLQISSSNLVGENGISSVDLEFKTIKEEIPADEEPGKDEEQVEDKPEEPEEPTEEKSYWYLWVLGIILAGVVVWLVLKNANKTSSKKSKKKRK